MSVIGQEANSEGAHARGSLGEGRIHSLEKESPHIFLRKAMYVALEGHGTKLAVSPTELGHSLSLRSSLHEELMRLFESVSAAHATKEMLPQPRPVQHHAPSLDAPFGPRPVNKHKRKPSSRYAQMTLLDDESSLPEPDSGSAIEPNPVNDMTAGSIGMSCIAQLFFGVGVAEGLTSANECVNERQQRKRAGKNPVPLLRGRQRKTPCKPEWVTRQRVEKDDIKGGSSLYLSSNEDLFEYRLSNPGHWVPAVLLYGDYKSKGEHLQSNPRFFEDRLYLESSCAPCA